MTSSRNNASAPRSQNPQPAEETPQALRERIAYLEESALYVSDLANTVHEQQDVFWRIAENIRGEVERLKSLLAEKSGVN